MASIGTRIAENRGKEGSVEEPPFKRPEKGDTSLNWFGEVVDVGGFTAHILACTHVSGFSSIWTERLKLYCRMRTKSPCR